MKKFILSVCAALMLFCGGASAKVFTMESNFGTVSVGATYNKGTGEFAWSQQYDNAMELFTNLEGKVSKYKLLKIKLTNPTHGYRLLFYKKGASNASVIEKLDASVTTVTWYLTSLKFEDGFTINDIDRICIAGAEDGLGSLTIKSADVTLETDDIETLTVTTTVDANSSINTPFQWYEGTEPKTQGVENNFGKTGGSVLWGYSSGNSVNNGYFSLNGYSALRVKVNTFDDTKNKNTTFRVMNADNKNHAVINMTSDETLVSCNVSKCTSLKSGAWDKTVDQKITSIDFIGEYQADNTVSPFAIAASKGSKVSYDRNFTNGQACTICLPFALTAEELEKVGKAYTLSAVTLSAVKGSTATFTPVAEIEAYKPYLLIPSDGGKLLKEITAAKDITAPTEAKTSVPGSYSFVGTLQAETSVKKDGMEVYGFSASEGKFVHASDKASIYAFRAYIAVPTTALSTAASRSIDIDFGGTTGINEIQNAHSSSAAATYDVAGKRVDKNYKGVVIRNGKKMIQK